MQQEFNCLRKSAADVMCGKSEFVQLATADEFNNQPTRLWAN
jgi:hypothetical protein